MNAREKARQLTLRICDIRNMEDGDARQIEDLLTSALEVPAGHIRTEHGADRPLLGNRWYCVYCKAVYAEYCNGCPKCHLGEPGTSTSLRMVFMAQTWDDQVARTPQEKVVHPRDSGTCSECKAIVV